jgi:hypothetical protein
VIAHIGGVTNDDAPQDNEPEVEHRPIFCIDLVLRIKAAKGQQLRFENVRRLIYEFSGHGFNIRKITTDSFQTLELTQAFQSRGYNAEILSVDRTKEPYHYLKRAIEEGRIRCYPYPVLERELLNLRDVGGKIDHPHKSTGVGKDLADALAGVVFSLGETFKNREPLLPIKGISHADNGLNIDTSITMAVDNKSGPKSYPKSVAPQYLKRKVDGTVEDLATRKYRGDLSDLILVG